MKISRFSPRKSKNFAFVLTSTIHIFIFSSLRGMVADVVEKSKEDSIWGVLTTPGFLELMGPENIYRSESNASHTTSDRFTKAVRR